MILELTTTPNLDLYGGPLAFAHVPWTIEVESGPGICERVCRTIQAFTCLHGNGFRWRAVFHCREDLALAYADGLIARAIHLGMVPKPHLLAEYLGLDSVMLAQDIRGLTHLEVAAAAAINAAVQYHYTLTVGSRPDPKIPSIYPAVGKWQWTLHDEQARKNLARAAEAVGVEIVP